MSQYTIASVSCGKDSLVIPHEYIKRGLRLDEVMMYDTGMEFQAIYDEWAALVKILDENGKSVFDLETRFKPEDERTAAGLSIRSREFFGELAARLERVQL